MKTNIHNYLRSLWSGPEERKKLTSHSNVANAIQLKCGKGVEVDRGGNMC